MNSTKITTKINKSLQNKNITSKKMNKLLKYYTKMTIEQQAVYDDLRDDQFMHCPSCNIIYEPHMTSTTMELSKCRECRE